MPTFCYVLFGILSILLLLLLFPVRLTISYDTDFRIYLTFFGIPLLRYPKKERVRFSDYDKTKVNKKKKRLLRKEKRKKNAAAKDKRSPRDILHTAKLVLRILKQTYPKLQRAFRLRICRLYAVVATEDAAKTAVLYGAVSQSFAYILALCEEFLVCRRSQKSVRVIPDFCQTDCTVRIKIRLVSNLFRLLRFSLAAVMAFFKLKTQDKKHTVQTEGDPLNG